LLLLILFFIFTKQTTATTTTKVLSFKQIFKSSRPHQLLLFLLFCFMDRSWEKVSGKAGQGVLPLEDDRHVQAV